MAKNNMSEGYTIVEMIVSLVVLSLFLALFFQVYSTNASQQLLVSRRAAAFDIATSNLTKVSIKTGLPVCDNAINSLLNPTNEGKIIATNQPGQPALTPTWTTAAAIANSATTGITVEPITGTSLPTNTYQELRVIYPQGCDPQMPVTVVSIVRFGSESVRRAVYIN